MIVSMGSPEAMEQFSASEIGDTDGNGYPEFLDGWGRPIWFLRWAPGFSPYSDIQTTDPTNNHDPFDPQHFDANAYKLIPLIYSDGSNNNPSQGIRGQRAYIPGIGYGLAFGALTAICSPTPTSRRWGP